MQVRNPEDHRSHQQPVPPMMRRLESLHQQVLQKSPEQEFLRNRHGKIDAYKVRNETKHPDMMRVRVDEMERKPERYGQNNESDEIQAALGDVAGLKAQLVPNIFQAADDEKGVSSDADAENGTEDVNVFRPDPDALQPSGADRKSQAEHSREIPPACALCIVFAIGEQQKCRNGDVGDQLRQRCKGKRSGAASQDEIRNKKSKRHQHGE